MALLLFSGILHFKCNAEYVHNYIYFPIFLIDATLMQLSCLKLCLVTSCNDYLCLGLALPFVASGIFWQYKRLLMLSCECTSVYRLNLIMHNYYFLCTLLTTFWCILRHSSTNIKPIIVLNGEYPMFLSYKKDIFYLNARNLPSFLVVHFESDIQCVHIIYVQINHNFFVSSQP